MAGAAERLFAERHVDPAAISVPVGFVIEEVASGLNNPSSVDFDEEGNIFVAEMGSPLGSVYDGGRLVRIRPDGSNEVVSDDFAGSLTGLVYYEGAFLVMEHAHESRVIRVFEDGARQVLAEELPGGGDHPSSDIVVAHSERLYFGQGTRTNSGVVGPDNADWALNHPELCDIPGADVVLSGRNFESPNLFGDEMVLTGAFKPFGVVGEEDEVIPGEEKSNGAIMRMDPDGGEFEMFAWGFRRPTGMSVHADGRIFCTDIGMEDRGSRPVADGSSYIWHVIDGGWYGWPDYSGGERVTDPKFRPKDGDQPQFLLKEHPPLTAKPVARLPRGSGIARFDFSRSPMFASDDTAFVALMGEANASEDVSAHGSKVVMVDVATGDVSDFAVNHQPGPASLQRSGGLERPIDVKFDRTGEMMYVLDCGVLYPTPQGALRTLTNSGVLWRIRMAI